MLLKRKLNETSVEKIELLSKLEKGFYIVRWHLFGKLDSSKKVILDGVDRNVCSST